MGLLGWLLAAGLGWNLAHRGLDAAELARLYQAGFCRPSVALLPLSRVSTLEAEVLRRRLARADTVRRFDPERLRATAPYALADDGRFWPSSAGAPLLAGWHLRWDGSESGVLRVQPYGAQAWQVPLRSQALVAPDASAYSGLVAYFDLGRVWIADVGGKRFQSLVQEPDLEQGGVLKFSADGTTLAFYFNQGGRWMVQDLYVLKDGS